MARNNRSKTITKMKFSELAAQWLLSVSHGIKESTLAHYHYTLERYLLPVFGGDRLSALDEQRLEQGILQVISAANGSHKPLGTSSSRECLTMLRRICKYAAHLHLMRSMEIFVKLPRMEPKQTKPFSAQEQTALRDFVLAAPTPRKVGLLLQMQLGLRIGEVCGLQWGDFDFKAGILTVRRTVSRIYCAPGALKSLCRRLKPRARAGKSPSRTLSPPCCANCGAAPARTPGFFRAALNARWSRAATARASGGICAGPLCVGCIRTLCATRMSSTRQKIFQKIRRNFQRSAYLIPCKNLSFSKQYPPDCRGRYLHVQSAYPPVNQSGCQRL